MKIRKYARDETQFGPAVAIVDGDGALLQLTVGRRAMQLERSAREGGAVRDPAACAHVFAQLAEYFEGTRQTFDLRLELEGSPFERQVWEALLAIPFGATKTYGELARLLEAPDGARAVGKAAGANRIPIVIPCHRLIGSDGKLVGFGLGLPMKQRLLDHERRVTGQMLALS